MRTTSRPSRTIAMPRTSIHVPGFAADLALEKNQIKPAIELVADFAQVADLGEAQTLVEADGSGISGVHPGDHDVLVAGCGPRQQRLQ